MFDPQLKHSGSTISVYQKHPCQSFNPSDVPGPEEDWFIFQLRSRGGGKGDQGVKGYRKMELAGAQADAVEVWGENKSGTFNRLML